MVQQQKKRELNKLRTKKYKQVSSLFDWPLKKKKIFSLFVFAIKNFFFPLLDISFF
jgi:hypothetical protein